ncbi:MAG: hypothetical protein DRJ03_04625 [Chloroflexi bacterium]|nr:MAG: hypothetical protein DRJ03_04625 [Chloroflexota bacterium]
MGINLVPGHDFTAREEVTAEKLRLWISGTKNSLDITGEEAGLELYDLLTTATWTSNATEGNLCFNTTKGMIEVRNRHGWVPLFGTQNGMFSLRVGLGNDRNIDNSYTFYRGYDGMSIKLDSLRQNLVLPAASFTLGIGFDNFGMPLVEQDYHDYVGACITGADTNYGNIINSLSRQPYHDDYNTVDGAITVPSSVTTTSIVQYPLVQFGGITPYYTSAGYGQSTYTVFRTDWNNGVRRHWSIDVQPQQATPLASALSWEDTYEIASFIRKNINHVSAPNYLGKCYF